MAGHARPALHVVEIIRKLLPGLLLAVDHACSQKRVLLQIGPQRTQEFGVFGELFDQNVARTVERGLGIRHLVAEVGGRGFLRVQRPILQQSLGQDPQPFLARGLRAGAPLGLVRKVQIFEFGLGRHRRDSCFQIVRELVLATDRFEHTGATRFEFAQIAQTVFQIAQLGVVQTAGDFLAVTGDERHCRAFVEQRHRRAHLLRTGADLLCDQTGDSAGGVGHG